MTLKLIFRQGIAGWTRVLVVRIRDSIHHLEDSRIYCVYSWPGRCLKPGHSGMDSFWPRVHALGLIWWRARGLDIDPEAGVGPGKDYAVDSNPYKPKVPAARPADSLWVEVLSANRTVGGHRCPICLGRGRTRFLTFPYQSLAGGEGQSQSLKWVAGLEFLWLPFWSMFLAKARTLRAYGPHQDIWVHCTGIAAEHLFMSCAPKWSFFLRSVQQRWITFPGLAFRPQV